MLTPLSSSDILHIFNSIKSKHRKIFTNYFFNAKQDLFLYHLDSASCIFLQRVEDFYRLYFIGDKKEYVEDLLSKLELPFRVILENLGRDDSAIMALSPKVWHYETTYIKMQKKLSASIDIDVHNLDIDMSLCANSFYYTNLFEEIKLLDANLSLGIDSVSCIFAQKIYSLIRLDFNKYFDYLPSKQSLQKHINCSHILVCSKSINKATSPKDSNIKSNVIFDKLIIGYLLFIPKGSSAYLNLISNYGSKASLVPLWHFFYRYLSKLHIRSLHLWCDIQNQRAMRMYAIEGFVPSGLKNIIYSKNLFAEKILSWSKEPSFSSVDNSTASANIKIPNKANIFSNANSIYNIHALSPNLSINLSLSNSNSNVISSNASLALVWKSYRKYMGGGGQPS
ncbi:hypothetical protein LS73_006890 [Helicobacter muridarum]|uniref:Uncharacterized protein n=1 Tax=Helicobacter muridarum TaxID=216 RepID=A0A4U8THR4_9HELI|nr:hypothetical protein [Helicobacter muridarum]TLD99791.1 hypothetical protein LS73_006890 [Helicobacter muridarum]